MPLSPTVSRKHAPTATRPGSASEPVTVVLRVRGVVQGVGFRPFIYRLANQHQLAGWVRNDGAGVLIQASGPEAALQAFIAAIPGSAPPAALVESVVEVRWQPVDVTSAVAGQRFVIATSAERDPPTTLIAPDLPICADCLRELFDPDDRRFRYPFINCTNCGPRYSIIESLPYDRPRTTMKAFALCESCAREYHDPGDRRFHAQPVACPDCGPRLHLTNARGEETCHGDDAVWAAARALTAGAIVAVKGLGGYHLACDARNEGAVGLLRERKVRRDKPFALMARDLATAGAAVQLDDVSRALLTSTPAPIVLAPKRQGPLGAPLPESLAPGSADLGVMLPYAPVHHLLFASGAPPLLVMTSANRAGEPIAYRDADALERLSGVADVFLMGDRPIARRIDDSVATVVAKTPVLLRRARGYAPTPVARHPSFERPVLALGAGLKNTITLATGGYAFTSQHLGDLDDLDVLLAFRAAIEDLTDMYAVDTNDAWLAHDLHPDYPSTRHAAHLPGRAIAIQHHAAHVASVLAERSVWDAPVLGFAFDGAGLGADGTIWGGEILHGTLTAGFDRVGHLRPVPLAGGDAAARVPQQAAVGFLLACEPELWRHLLDDHRTRVAEAMIRARIRSPHTSSIGRLFDAAAALCGFEGTMSYEGQAAMGLEAQAWRSPGAPSIGSRGLDTVDARRALADGYPLPFAGGMWDGTALLEALLLDLRAGTPTDTVALRFHGGLARAVTSAAQELRRTLPFDAVVLSGGVWQNRLLVELSVFDLQRSGFDVWLNRVVPPGDGGISLGQAALAAAARGRA